MAAVYVYNNINKPNLLLKLLVSECYSRCLLLQFTKTFLHVFIQLCKVCLDGFLAFNVMILWNEKMYHHHHNNMIHTIIAHLLHCYLKFHSCQLMDLIAEIISNNSPSDLIVRLSSMLYGLPC